MSSSSSEDARLASLRAYHVLDTPPEERFDELTRLAAYVCKTPTSLVTLIDEERQWFKSRHGFAAEQTDRDIAFCAYVVEDREVIVVNDAQKDARFANNPLVTGPPYIRFYAGAPLLVPGGHVLGSLAVIDYVPRELDGPAREALVTLSHQVVTELELRRHLAEQTRLQREDAERFALVARATNDAVWDWNLITNEIWWSEGMRTLFGYPPEDVPNIDRWTETLHPDDEKRVTEKLFGAIQSDEQFWSDAYRFRRHDGTWADILDRGYVIHDEHGKPCRMIGAMLDITERNRLEDQLRQAQKMEAIGQLSGGIAHDFNNLLTVIQVNAALLGRNSKDRSVRDHTDAINEATDRAAALTRQLLMMSRRQIMQEHVIDLNDVVTQLSRMLQRIVGEDIALVAQPRSNLPAVSADVGMIEQVLLNIVINARDAMPRGGQLTIVTGDSQIAAPQDHQGFEAPPGHYVWISVSDTGTGIAAEHLPHIFEPFYTTKDIGHGTGLGLATAYGIVRQHRGWISVTSELGGGTTFKIYVPATDKPFDRVRPIGDDAELPTGTETILVVEDELALRHLVVSLLESCGYSVLPASSGVAALSIWNKHADEIQLVITDVIMPGGMSGRELADRLRELAPALPVVFTSGYSPELAGGGEPLVEGVNFLPKPYHPGRLARTVRNALDRARQQAG